MWLSALLKSIFIGNGGHDVVTPSSILSLTEKCAAGLRVFTWCSSPAGAAVSVQNAAFYKGKRFDTRRHVNNC